MLIAFCDQKAIVHHKFVPEGETVNQHFYQQVLIRLHNRVRRSKWELWSDKLWLFHHDNAPAHKAISVRQLLVKKQITALNYPPYSPDLAPCNFCFFFQDEGCDKRNSFLVSRRNQGFSDEGAEETQRRRFYQVVPWVAGLNAKVY